ncbi:DUF3349 domain-containing protein [Microlunatus soli]|uniref:DUF3349 domain-containing protein n=1 Tax=Microlunatus soli TaxID=630515 RepID=A0A1H1ZXZ4_9ACTN|nr:DUF3349 domain-containing protein [Microlunatus soli]SDT38550.1 Protein of unknown function [Microlunatus soli]
MTPSFLAAIINWLRVGYPDGVPEQDYVPLFALLARRLSSEEVHQIAEAIIRRNQGAEIIDGATNVDIGVQITKLTDEMPREEDVARVRSRLAAAGWPLADPNRG